MPHVRYPTQRIFWISFSTSLDIASRFHQIKIYFEDNQEMQCIVKNGHYEWVRMPLVPKHVLITFQAIMENVPIALENISRLVPLKEFDNDIIYKTQIKIFNEGFRNISKSLLPFQLHDNFSKELTSFFSSELRDNPSMILNYRN